MHPAILGQGGVNKIISLEEAGAVGAAAIDAVIKSPLVTVVDSGTTMTINVRDDDAGRHAGFDISRPFTRKKLAAAFRVLANELARL